MIDRVKRAFKEVWYSSPPLSEGAVSLWRERVFTVTFLSMVLLGVVPLLSSIRFAIRQGDWLIAWATLLAYLSFCAILLLRRIPYTLRILFGLSVYYALGWLSFLVIGPVGSYRLWLFAAPVAASLFLGLRGGLVALALSIGSLVVSAMLAIAGRLTWPVAEVGSSGRWIVTSVTFVFLASVTTVGLSVFVRNLEEALRDQRMLVDDLTHANRLLEEQILERRRAEEELARARQEWEEVFQAVGHPMIIIDPQRIIMAANRATVEATSMPVSELVGRRCYEVFHRNDQPPAQCPLPKMHRSERFEATEMEVEALGGTFLVSCTPVFDDEGALEKVIHVATDITERKRAEEALRHHREHLEELVEERTRELRKLVDAMVGREVRMAELKKVIENLRQQLEAAGLEPVADDPLLGG